MKKILLNILIGLIIIGGITIGNAMAQGTPPNIKVSLATDNLTYLLDNPGTPAVDPDRIQMVLTFKNNGGNVITPIGFSQRPFHLQLVFTDPDGKIITANELGDTMKGEPEPPPVIPVNGQLLQAEPVENLANGWVLSIGIPDAHAYYSLMKAGRYSVKARIPMRTYNPTPGYSCIDYTVGTISYSRIETRPDCSIWAGALESNPAYFTIVADNDRDGYYYPVAYGQHAEADCDDNNKNVNPGMADIPGNGIDDDCNPSTSDGTVTQVIVLNPNGGETIPSGSNYTVRWVAPSSSVKFDLGYSCRPGTWSLIANNLTGNNYNWTVPKPLRNEANCRVGVRGYNLWGGIVGTDTSDNPFTIEVVKVTAPNGGEILPTVSGCRSFDITWRTNGTASPVSKTMIYGSGNGGTTWKLITTMPGNPGVYHWNVPSVSPPKTNCKIGVVLKDASGNTLGSDISDAFFTIQP